MKKNTKLSQLVKERARIRGRFISNKDTDGIKAYAKKNNITIDFKKDLSLQGFTKPYWEKVKKMAKQLTVITKVKTKAALERDILFYDKIYFLGREYSSGQMLEFIRDFVNPDAFAFITAKYKIDFLEQTITIEYFYVYDSEGGRTIPEGYGK